MNARHRCPEKQSPRRAKNEGGTRMKKRFPANLQKTSLFRLITRIRPRIPEKNKGLNQRVLISRLTDSVKRIRIFNRPFRNFQSPNPGADFASTFISTAGRPSRGENDPAPNRRMKRPGNGSRISQKFNQTLIFPEHSGETSRAVRQSLHSSRRFLPPGAGKQFPAPFFLALQPLPSNLFYMVFWPDCK